MTNEGLWAETRVPMLVVAPFHAQEEWLAHWNALKIGMSLSHDILGAFLMNIRPVQL